MPVFIKQLKNTQEITPILALRYEVFCQEQFVPLDEEIDKYDQIFDDKVVFHFGYYNNNLLIGCARVIQERDFYKIGRVAVKKEYRKQGHGYNMLKEIINLLPKTKYYYLSAQLDALSLYEKLGFSAYGDVYLDANIKHIDMRRDLDE